MVYLPSDKTYKRQKNKLLAMSGFYLRYIYSSLSQCLNILYCTFKSFHLLGVENLSQVANWTSFESVSSTVHFTKLGWFTSGYRNFGVWFEPFGEFWMLLRFSGKLFTQLFLLENKESKFSFFKADL